MRYFIDKDGSKVGLYSVMTCIDGRNAVCIDAKGKEYRLPLDAVLEDNEPATVTVSIPVEFPTEFVPGETFDKDRCIWCPFFEVEEDIGCYCNHQRYDKETGCPIRKHFVE